MDLAHWQENPDPETFPYDEVVAEFHRGGKHFVGRELLECLDRVRSRLEEDAGPAHLVLARFLDTALDKFDGRYDNPSYLALEQLELPGADGCPDPGHAGRTRDRLLVLLMADVVRHELAAASGRTDFLPRLRPDARLTMKRCRHAVRAARPAVERLGIDVDLDGDDPLEVAGRLACAVLRTATPAELRKLQLTALPVYVTHDEYMFLRTLQSYETAFALVAVQVRAAIAALGRGDAEAATRAIEAAELTMRESSPLFSLVGTMQPEAFLDFRQYTDGASAIQSRNYKLVESLCRTPDSDRLESPAYRSVPEVHAQVVAGQPNLDDALVRATASSLLTAEGYAAVRAAMDGFEAAILKWRKTHHSMAAHMLGDRRGTGYTEGVGYLAAVRTIPVFDAEPRCPFGHDAPRPRDDDSTDTHRPPSRQTWRPVLPRLAPAS